MERVVIDYAPRDAFKSFHKRKERWAVVVAHRRAGKSVACINDMIKRAITDGKENARYAYIAPYYNQAKSVAWDYLMRFSEPIRKSQNISELWVELVNGARIRLFGADNADALRGLYFDGVVLDEYGDWRAGVYSTVIRPALSDRKGWAVFIGTPKGKNAFYDLWEGAESDESWFRLKVKASESGILDAEELADARRSMTDDQYSQEYEASFEAAVVGAVYSKEMAMVRDADQISRVPYDPSLPVHTAWDLGVGDATAIVFWQQIGREVRVIDCYESNGEGLPHYAALIKSKSYNYGTHYAPHDIAVREFGSGKSRIDVAREWGIDFVMAPKQSLEDGIHAVRMLLPRCWFDAKKCETLTEALHHYRWDMDNKSGELKPRPVHDWACFTGDTVILTRHGMHQMSDAPKTGEVLTPCGWKQYRNLQKTRANAQLVEVTFSDGYSVRCTPEHLFLTVSGWKSAEHLETGSLIQSSLTLSRSISMAVYTVCGRVKDTLREVVRSCIGMFGVMRLETYPRGTTSITKTLTQQTISYQTLSACTGKSIFPHQPQSETTTSSYAKQTGKLLATLSSLKLRVRKLLTGIGPRQDVCGTSDKQSSHRFGQSGSGFQRTVSSVARSLRRWTERTGTHTSSAQRTAKPLRIAHVKTLDATADVYCLTVDDGHWFSLQNGAVVHNCHMADAARYMALSMQEVQSKRPASASRMPSFSTRRAGY